MKTSRSALQRLALGGPVVDAEPQQTRRRIMLDGAGQRAAQREPRQANAEVRPSIRRSKHGCASVCRAPGPWSLIATTGPARLSPQSAPGHKTASGSWLACRSMRRLRTYRRGGSKTAAIGTGATRVRAGQRSRARFRAVVTGQSQNRDRRTETRAALAATTTHRPGPFQAQGRLPSLGCCIPSSRHRRASVSCAAHRRSDA